MTTFNRATEQFFAGCRQQKLLIQFCPRCQSHIFYLRSFCPDCLGELEIVEASGKGKIVSYTIVHKNPFDRLFDQMTPYIAGLIELDEGVYMYGQIVAKDLKKVKIAGRVEVIFLEQDGKSVPAFQSVEKD